MKYWDERSQIGDDLYYLVFLASKFLMRHMWLYHILNYTWGILTTIAGWIMLTFVDVFMKKSIFEKGKFGPSRYIIFGDNWGGLECGTNFLVAGNMGDDWTLHTKCHELGHTFQNAVLGPFAIFISFIPSVIRYWYQEIRSRKGKENKPYDQAWFEESATDVGTYYYENYIKKEAN